MYQRQERKHDCDDALKKDSATSRGPVVPPIGQIAWAEVSRDDHGVYIALATHNVELRDQDKRNQDDTKPRAIDTAKGLEWKFL